MRRCVGLGAHRASWRVSVPRGADRHVSTYAGCARRCAGTAGAAPSRIAAAVAAAGFHRRVGAGIVATRRIRRHRGAGRGVQWTRGVRSLRGTCGTRRAERAVGCVGRRWPAVAATCQEHSPHAAADRRWTGGALARWRRMVARYAARSLATAPGADPVAATEQGADAASAGRGDQSSEAGVNWPPGRRRRAVQPVGVPAGGQLECADRGRVMAVLPPVIVRRCHRPRVAWPACVAGMRVAGRRPIWRNTSTLMT